MLRHIFNSCVCLGFECVRGPCRVVHELCRMKPVASCLIFLSMLSSFACGCFTSQLAVPPVCRCALIAFGSCRLLLIWHCWQNLGTSRCLRMHVCRTGCSSSSCLTSIWSLSTKQGRFGGRFVQHPRRGGDEK